MAAAVAVALVTVIGAGSSGGPGVADAAIIHHALRAVTPPRSTNTQTRPRRRPSPTRSQVRQEFASGQAQVNGTVVIDGASLYKIDLPHGLVGYFDPSTYAPRYVDNPRRDGTVVRLRVVAKRRLLARLSILHPQFCDRGTGWHRGFSRNVEVAG